MERSDYLELTKNDYLELKRLYQKASEDDQISFQFKEKEILTGYAKYMIEYLESRMDKS